MRIIREDAADDRPSERYMRGRIYIQTPEELLLKCSRNWGEGAEEAVKHLISTYGLCLRSGEPRRMKKLSISKLNRKLNDFVKIDFM